MFSPNKKATYQNYQHIKVVSDCVFLRLLKIVLPLHASKQHNISFIHYYPIIFFKFVHSFKRKIKIRFYQFFCAICCIFCINIVNITFCFLLNITFCFSRNIQKDAPNRHASFYLLRFYYLLNFWHKLNCKCGCTRIMSSIHAIKHSINYSIRDSLIPIECCYTSTFI